MIKQTTRNENETFQLGEQLGGSLGGPRIILLKGELGAGKTAFTRGILSGMDFSRPDSVHSPSFSLVNQYHLPGAIVFHVDLYRLESQRDLYSIGLDELLDGTQTVIIEWAEKLPWESENPVEVRFEVTGDESREIEIFGLGPEAEQQFRRRQ